ncbi:MAG: ComEC/Rec2 family competence protein [Caldimicrobium sp.]|nr:ComEC/Rec2 family competence protein [Caldimicrobium sp.]MCX7613672.1 ComEC/Rec2 family competence protein [Caldimicrobium sp.]MDW8182703.1 ComEC/Rec2 family competence protein [Caldimicrobium sp.]
MRENPLFIFSLALIFGLFFAFYKIPPYVLIILLPITGLMFRRKYAFTLCLLTVLSYGSGWWIYSRDKERLEDLLGTRARVTILRVEPYFDQYRIRAQMEDLGEIEFFSKKDSFKPKDFCEITLKGKRIQINPYAPSTEEISLVKDIVGEFRLDEKAPVYCVRSEIFTVENFRYRLFQFSQELSPLARGLFQALVLGAETQLPKEYLETLREQGLYHQLAISGYNLAVLYGLIYKIMRFSLSYTPILRLGFPIQLWAMLSALPGAALILILSGFQPPTIRAFFFLCALILGRLLFRNTPPVLILFLTADILLIFDPSLIGSISFQLSFVATLALLLTDTLLRENRYHRELANDKIGTVDKIKYWLLFSLVASTMVSLFTFPFIISLNGEFPLFTPINNLLATPLWSLIFIPGSIFVALLAFISPSLAREIVELLAELFSLYMKIPLFSWQLATSLPVNIFMFWLMFNLILGIYLWKLPMVKSHKLALGLFVPWLSFAALKGLCDKTNLIMIPKFNNLVVFIIKEESRYFLVVSEDKRGLLEREKRLYPLLKRSGIRELEGVLYLSDSPLEESSLRRDWSRHFKVKSFYMSYDYEIFESLRLFKPATEVIPLEGDKLILEFKGLTILYKKKHLHKEDFSPQREFTILPHRSKWGLPDKGEVIYENERDSALYLYPKGSYILYLSEKKRREGLLSRLLFPLVPYWVEVNIERSIPYDE